MICSSLTVIVSSIRLLVGDEFYLKFDEKTGLRSKEAQIIIEQWGQHDITMCPHSSLGFPPPAAESIIHLHQTISMN